MRNVFADAGYWIALVNPQDDLHQRSKEVSASLGPVRYTTSEMVLTEFLNSFANRGEHLRKVAVALVERLREDPNTTIVPQTSLLFRDALSLFAERHDKAWSQTDCASFQIMRGAGIGEGLTYDKHFEQAGFRALLREER